MKVKGLTLADESSLQGPHEEAGADLASRGDVDDGEHEVVADVRDHLVGLPLLLFLPLRLVCLDMLHSRLCHELVEKASESVHPHCHGELRLRLLLQTHCLHYLPKTNRSIYDAIIKFYNIGGSVIAKILLLLCAQEICSRA